jgi:hypothetical protein
MLKHASPPYNLQCMEGVPCEETQKAQEVTEITNDENKNMCFNVIQLYICKVADSTEEQ